MTAERDSRKRKREDNDYRSNIEAELPCGGGLAFFVCEVTTRKQFFL